MDIEPNSPSKTKIDELLSEDKDTLLNNLSGSRHSMNNIKRELEILLKDATWTSARKDQNEVNELKGRIDVYMNNLLDIRNDLINSMCLTSKLNDELAKFIDY